MPLAAEEHGPAAVQAFLWGLLPDNERVLDRWAKKFQVSARNVLALISHVGEDCAGAVQFVTPDRLEALKSGKDDKVEWLDEAALAKRLQALREDHAAWRLPRDTGQFSLAGAQPKTALLLQKDRWGIPSGRIPTTHILKPPTGHFDGHAENEHICLQLARSLGMPVADTKVMRFKKKSPSSSNAMTANSAGTPSFAFIRRTSARLWAFCRPKNIRTKAGQHRPISSNSCAATQPTERRTLTPSSMLSALIGSLREPMPTQRITRCFWPVAQL
jgi:hypothetical protein